VAEVTRLLFASWASTVALKEVPAVAVVGTVLNTSFVAAPGLTVIAGEVTVYTPLVAVIVYDPAVFRVTEKDLVPLTIAAAAGGVAAASVVVIEVLVT